MPKVEGEVWVLVVTATDPKQPCSKMVGIYGSKERAELDAELYNVKYWTALVEPWKVEA